MKRQSLLLFGWLLLASPAAVQAQFNYTVTNQTITITGYTGTSSVVDIPSTINGLPVISIGIGAFDGSSLISVTIPNAVTSLGVRAFFECYSLTNVTIGSGVTSIGDSAFSGCYSLTNITLGSGVTSIGDYAFSGCTSLTNIMVDPLNPAFSSVAGVLFNQSQTTLLQYPAGKVGGYTIPNSITTIADSAFAFCSGLTSITIPNRVTSIGDSVFSGCGLTSITIPNSVTNIGDDAFGGCTSLTRVTIPNSVTSIGDFAFFYCTSLTNVTIGNNVTSIGDRAFYYCSSLTAINVETNNPVYSSMSGVLFDKSQTTLIEYPADNVATTYAIPNTVTSIGDLAFFHCTSLTNVIITNSVTNIGDFAFFYCTSLTNVTIPNSVSSIGDGAFDGCNSLTSLYFQGNAPSLGGVYVFYDDNSPTIYYLPGTTGWGSTFDGMPTALWALPYPLILTSTPNFGAPTNQFGFTVSWATNLSVVIEASPDLGNPKWSPVTTNALNGGTFQFTDPQWTNYPARFYRIRSP